MPYRTGTGRRKRAKVDSNQESIVEALRLFGFSVKITSQQGKGFPDLIVGALGCTYLVEVKAKGGKLTPDQIKFIDSWQGQVWVIFSIDEFIDKLEREHEICMV